MTKAWSVCQGTRCVFSPLPCGSGHQGDHTLGFPEPQKEPAGPRVPGSGLVGIVPSPLPSWNSPSAAGRARNLKPKTVWFAQARLGPRWLCFCVAPHTSLGTSCGSWGHQGPGGLHTSLSYGGLQAYQSGSISQSSYVRCCGGAQKECGADPPPSRRAPEVCAYMFSYNACCVESRKHTHVSTPNCL